MTTSVSSSQRRRDDLRGFLRHRRAALGPADVGLPDIGRRRTPGLRREEVALLAGVGVSWYTWLEQGRDITTSDSVVEAISTALRLSEAERRHLYRLADRNPPAPRSTSSSPSETLYRLLDAWLPNPGYVRDRHWNILARNRAADAVFDYQHQENCLLAFFTNPAYRARHEDWETNARRLVAQLRTQSAQYPDDQILVELATTLRQQSPEFAALWDEHHVESDSSGTKAIQHPDVGLLVLDATLLTLPEHPDLSVVLYTPHPDTDTEQRLARL